MRLKARPDLHHAPLPNGVFVSAGTGEFALSGWAGFADLMSRCLPLLNRGPTRTSWSPRSARTRRGAPSAAAQQLDAHGMVLHLDTMTSAEPTSGARTACGALAYLECQSDDPYAAFEEIRSARVLLVGPEEPSRSLTRAAGARGGRHAGAASERTHTRPSWPCAANRSSSSAADHPLRPRRGGRSSVVVGPPCRTSVT